MSLTSLTFDSYQRQAFTTAQYPNRGNNIIYPTLGLCGESGEVAEKVKKIIRDNDGIIDAERKELLKKEISDVLWYVAALCTELQLDMGDVAQSNLDKLFDRMKRDVIKGSGDLR